MNIGAAASAAGGGVLVLGSFVLASVVFLFSLLFAGGYQPFGSPEYGGPGLLGILVLTPSVAAAGGALPALALGAPWPRSVLASSLGATAFFLQEYGYWQNSEENATLLAFTLILWASVVALTGSVSQNLPLRGVLVLFCVSATLLVLPPLAAELDSFLLYAAPLILAWVLLPALAGAFLPVGDR